MLSCNECLHYDVCQALEEYNDIPKVHPKQCGCFKPKADYTEVVRCKDCENCRDFNKLHKYCTEHSDGWGNSTVYVEDDDYCSFGIRKKVR